MLDEYRPGILAIVISIAVGFAAYFAFGYEVFAKVSSALLVLFSILAGLLAQVMVFTGTVITPSMLSDEKVSAIEVALDQQQQEWRIQFFFYLAAVAVCAAPDLFGDSGPKILQNPTVRQGYVGFSVAVVCVAAVRSLRIPTAIIRLQRLRFRAIRDDMKAAAAARQAVGSTDLGSGLKFKGPAVHPDHGSIVDLPQRRG